MHTSLISLPRKLLIVFILLPLVVYAKDNSDVVDLDNVVPIVSAKSQQQSITRNGLSAIFKMRLQQWRDGSSIKVYVLNDKDPVHNAFSKKILNVFPHQLRRGWNKLVFSGSGQAPIELQNLETMLSRIASTPGAIGYAPTDMINDQISVLKMQ